MPALSKPLALVALLAVLPARAAAPTFTIETHTAPDSAYLVSSHVVASGGDVLLVDSQMLLDQVDQFVELAQKQKGKVKTVFVTHAHPENYLGLQRIQEAFPEARLLARPDTAESIRTDGPRTLKYYRETYSNGAWASRLATEVPEVQAHTARTLKVGRVDFEVLSFPQAEGKSFYALYHRPSATLIAGDLLYNNAHLWLADQQPGPWIAALEQLRKLKLERVYPGHGEPGGPELVQQNLEYLKFFKHVIETTYSAGGVVQRMQMKYPELRLKPALHIAAARYYPPVRHPEEAGPPVTADDDAKAR